MKKLGLAFIAIVVLTAGAALFLHSNLDSLVKSAIEKYGSEAAKTDVRVDSVKLSLASGEGVLKGLTVRNAKGFDLPDALGMAVIDVKIDNRSITGNGPIIIREITIDKPLVVFEANKAGDTNLQTLQRGMSSGASSNKTDGSKERKIIINDLYIRSGHISISHPLLPTPLSTGLPTIHLTNIGKNSNGATASQVADQVLSSIIKSANKVASSELAKNLEGSIKDTVSGAADSIHSGLKGLLGN